jgi:hypothetical protein
MSQHLDHDRIWSVAKAAIHAYEEAPTEVNASKVELAVNGIRDMKEESTWRHWRDSWLGHNQRKKL